MMKNPTDNRYWTSLEDLSEQMQASPDESDVRSILHSRPAVDRRSFLKLMGLSLATGVLSSCRRPVEKIIPYVHQPDGVTPGVANWYATTCHGCGAACGALAKVMDGRPIKFEGNPGHLVSRGGLCAAGQGSVLSLYDPYRQKSPAEGAKPATWEQADRQIARALASARAAGGKVVVLTSTLTGPATRALVAEFLSAFGNGEHIVYDHVPYESLREAHRLAYGQPIIPGYRFDRAEVIVGFGADFLGTWLSPVEFIKQYASGRSLPEPKAHMSRHFQFESRLSLTGSSADYRHRIAPSEQALYVASLLARVAQKTGAAHAEVQALKGLPLPDLSPEGKRRLDKTADALALGRGKSLIISDSGDDQVQLAVIALNELLGNIGRTITLTRPDNRYAGRTADISRLIEEMRQGKVSVLLVHGCNPAYAFPDAEAFAEGLKQVACSVSTAVASDETAALAKWHCPASHPMETWGDAEPQAGRFSLYQPTLQPLYDTRAFEDSLLRWSRKSVTFHDYLRSHWQKAVFPLQNKRQDFGSFWEAMLQQGFLETPPPPQKGGPFQWPKAVQAARHCASRPRATGLEVEVFEPISMHDGAAANNPWLQELPDPVTKITWGNYAAIAPAMASEKGIREGQWVEIETEGRKVSLPAHIQPGQHPGTVSVPLGYGRSQAGPIGSGIGVNVYPLITTGHARLTSAQVKSLTALGQETALALTQVHSSLEGRQIVKEMLYSQHHQSDHGEDHRAEEAADLWGAHEYPDYKWGMVIDLTKCIGCSGCVMSCNVENNIPVVGPEEVRHSREMHWLRIDRYYKGDPDDPDVVYEPMLCQHCGNASCETVCPVLATVHDNQGLSVQVYNRCVGTRYCANNCAYKVRRFNFFNNIKNDLTQNLALNPDVIVRSRGVMEKCSFCIQRIQAARIRARQEEREVADREVRTACEQSCPADAIVFGNLADPKSRVSRLAASSRSFRVLEELNRQPSVHYLARVRNRDEEEVG
ncbi:MAG: 4Fe-4S dicluster domain-containing protein [Armatimonadetes bacterium]|nr:4Fe-4S dicluster domain-containing protein [Armatimonadota bacterium]